MKYKILSNIICLIGVVAANLLVLSTSVMVAGWIGFAHTKTPITWVIGAYIAANAASIAAFHIFRPRAQAS